MLNRIKLVWLVFIIAFSHKVQKCGFTQCLWKTCMGCIFKTFDKFFNLISHLEFIFYSLSHFLRIVGYLISVYEVADCAVSMRGQGSILNNYWPKKGLANGGVVSTPLLIKLLSIVSSSRHLDCNHMGGCEERSSQTGKARLELWNR